MKLKIKDSSVIKTVAYDKITRNMDITFPSKSTYTYYNVPENVVQEFINADSLGKYFNKNIKGHYTNRLG